MDLLSSHARQLLLDYLAKAEHSQWQSRQLLLRRRFDEAIIDQQINYAIQHSFIDDARYSEIYIRSWINRGIGKRLLISKLYEQRIDPTIWKPLLEVMYKEEDGSHKLEEQMQSYIARQKEMPAQKLKEKVFGYFIRKGYDLDEVMRAWLATQAGNIGQ
ncbi:MAG: RecX family transcriptional regulator [Candidatus Cloacimonetes bacterium]|nr:RecX family transcriptional regulator [Candidatus Cloacimonadota bacterium]